MTKYKCERCNKEFVYKNDYTRHVERKNPCKEIAQNSTISAQNSTFLKKDTNDENNIVCRYCRKEFSRLFTLNRHIDGYCKAKKANDCKMEELMEKLIKLEEDNKKIHNLEERLGKNDKEIEELKKENAKYKKIINNTQNIKIDTLNNTVNINIAPYGQEDLSYITKKDYQKIFSRANMSVPAFVEQVHFNKNKPENHNVYISNMRADYGLMYDGEQWAIHNKEDLLDNMYEDKTIILLDKFEHQYDSLDEQTKKMFERFVKRHEKDDDKLKTIVKKELQQILYNKRKMAIETKNSVQE